MQKPPERVAQWGRQDQDHGAHVACSRSMSANLRAKLGDSVGKFTRPCPFKDGTGELELVDGNLEERPTRRWDVCDEIRTSLDFPLEERQTLGTKIRPGGKWKSQWNAKREWRRFVSLFFSREGTVEGKWIRKGFCSKERHSTGKALRGNGMTEINYHTWAFLGRTVYGYGARGEGLANWITIIVIAAGVTFNPNPKDWPSVGADNLEQDRFSFDTFTVEV